MKLTLKIPLDLYYEITHAAFAAQEDGEELEAEDYVRECIDAGLSRDRKARRKPIAQCVA